MRLTPLADAVPVAEASTTPVTLAISMKLDFSTEALLLAVTVAVSVPVQGETAVHIHEEVVLEPNAIGADHEDVQESAMVGVEMEDCSV